MGNRKVPGYNEFIKKVNFHREEKRRKAVKTKKKKIRIAHFLPIYAMILPGFLYLIINNYLPMFGIIIAFKRLDFRKGILFSDWAGLDNFKFLFASGNAFRMIRNTILYNVVFIILGIVMGVTTAILMNEVTSKGALKAYQTLILIPNLMSFVIINYLVYAFLAPDTGLVNNSILLKLGKAPISWYTNAKYWPFILTFVNMWQSIGFTTVIYYSSIIGISTDYYEAATLDGASKWQQITNITLPLLKPTIITLFILSLGRIFGSNFGLFYQVPRNQGMLYPTTQTIDVFVFNALMNNNDYSMSSAASVFQSVAGAITLISANALIRKVQPEDSLF